jgi:Flp pilus assembly protein TadB
MQSISADVLARAGVLLDTGKAVLLALLLAKRGMNAYRSRFVRTLSASLRRNFLLTDPQNVFVLSILSTTIGATAANFWIWPIGAVVADLLGLVGPKLVMHVNAKRRVKQFVYQLPDALLAWSSALQAGSNRAKGVERRATHQPAPLRRGFMIAVDKHRMGRSLADP